MPRRSALPLAALAAALAAHPAAAQAPPAPPATPGPPAPVYHADVPIDKQLYRDGPSGRFLMAGPWLFRLDPTEVGINQHFQRQTSTAGWAITTVPNAWNARDESQASMMGTIGWYRKDFKLPDTAKRLSWVVRFESVNYRSKVWLNGRPLGTNRGAYLPFEFRLPAGILKRTGTNRLVIRVDNRRFPTDFPPSGLDVRGVPTGGWWNYGGILREVYLRRIDRIDFNTVQIRPELPCGTCDATIDYRVTLRNYADSAQRVHLVGRYGKRSVDLGTAAIGAKRFATFTKRIVIRHPRLWAPDHPNLYTATLDATVGGKRVAHYYFQSGIRSIKVSPDGHLLLNGKPLDFRGVGLHEDSLQYGFAINNPIRDQLLAWVKEVGANLIRAHYPLHPYIQEQADRLGIMLWSEIPVYAIKTQYLAQRLVRDLAAKELQENILANQNHPSIITWSIANELSSRPGPVQGYYIANAVRTAHTLDPTRPVAMAISGYPAAGCQPEYGPLDMIGVNEYFGWYPGPNGQIADRTLLPDYLDSVRQCYPNKAIVISEFGAEANRDGPVEEKGTFQFQQDFVNYHLGVYVTKPWLSGAIYWAIQEFRVRPNWDGGNPRPQPPIHQKGLITFDGHKKPAFFDVQRWYRSTPLYR
jgi:beta-glucuronidase